MAGTYGDHPTVLEKKVIAAVQTAPRYIARAGMKEEKACENQKLRGTNQSVAEIRGGFSWPMGLAPLEVDNFEGSVALTVVPEPSD